MIKIIITEVGISPRSRREASNSNDSRSSNKSPIACSTFRAFRSATKATASVTAAISTIRVTSFFSDAVMASERFCAGFGCKK